VADLDTAELSLILALRPGRGGDPGQAKPTAGLVVRFDPGPGLADTVTRGLLARGWELVAAPVGHFDPQSSQAVAHVECRGDRGIEITTNRGVVDELLYTSPAAIHATLPAGWVELAQVRHAALVYLAMSSTPVTTEDEIEQVARSGYLVGGWATLTMGHGWAAQFRPHPGRT